MKKLPIHPPIFSRPPLHYPSTFSFFSTDRSKSSPSPSVPLFPTYLDPFFTWPPNSSALLIIPGSSPESSYLISLRCLVGFNNIFSWLVVLTIESSAMTCGLNAFFSLEIFSTSSGSTKLFFSLMLSRAILTWSALMHLWSLYSAILSDSWIVSINCRRASSERREMTPDSRSMPGAYSF